MTISSFSEDRPAEAGPAAALPVWTAGVILAILFAYAAGFALVGLAAGPWQAVRDFAAEGLILFLWLLAARRLLRGKPVIAVPVRWPRFELTSGLVTAAVLGAGAALFYRGETLAIYINLALIYALPLAILLLQPDRRLALGLRLPPRRAWLTLLAIVVINAVVGLTLGSLLPEGELPTPPGADLVEEFTSAGRVAFILLQLTVIAAIPEELFFRVFFQPRLSRFLPVGWAILVQALLFSAAHLPQGLIRYGEPWPIALAGLFTMANGIIGGYLWYRIRSLPLLVLVHLLAYPRIGL